MINLERAKVGAQALTYREDLTQAATIRAQESASFWSHTRPNGQPYYTADERIYGENLAKSFRSPEEIFKAWMDSPTHRKNILDAKFKGACIGVCNKGGKQYVSLEFTKS